jgi:2-succinyl-5-enolpyruvyl-6-hydroxy-3-cyclohexene-1-carboxylate synthase
MYTIVKNAQIVLSLLKQHGIKYIIINPGTTNVPIVQGIQNDPFFKCFSIVDERSALYFAIGLFLKTGERVAITCTSAQATRNFIPGLTEAFYKHVPILAITVSKHPKYDYQGYPQHPIQTSMPEDAVKKSFALPHVSNSIDELQCIRMVNEAILELTHRSPGPIQLNLPMLDADLAVFCNIDLPKVRLINRYMIWDNWQLDLIDKKVLIIVGEHRPFNNKQTLALDEFTESYNALVYVNHLSNYHGKYTVNANIILSVMNNKTFMDILKPDIVISIGGSTGDYPLLSKLSSGTKDDFEHWHISENGEIMDTYDKLTKVFECPFELFFQHFSQKRLTVHNYYKTWQSAYEEIQIPNDLPFSYAYFAQELHAIIPKNSYLNFAIVNSLTIWNLFPLDPSIICYSNIAAFGIDGCMSTLLGQSIETDNLCFLVTGDLAFFYDMNSLGIRHLKNNIRILLVNNYCGVTFRMNADLYEQVENDVYPYIAAKGHYKDARGWVETCGFKYLTASSKEEFIKYKSEFVSESNQSIVFEVFTKPEDEVESLHNYIYKKNIIESNLKSTIRSFIGEKGVKVLKNVIKK